MPQKIEREEKKRSRIMCYFIDAAIELLDEEGIQAVTIRKVANKAGYTSATLYNYFDNLTHLLFLATMNHLEEYNNDLPNYVENCTDPIDVYLAVCSCFTKHSLEKPEIFELLFFTHENDTYEEYVNQYYKLYPKREKKIKTKLLNELFHANSLHKRGLNVLMPCVEQGMIDEELAIDYTDICLRFNKTILEDVKNSVLTKEEGMDLMLKYYANLLRMFVQPEYKELVKEYKEYIKE